jgi:hypothetical protein
MTANEFADRHNSSQRLFDGGSLCIWGNWFGRPMDNIHKITSVSFDQDKNILTLTFDNNERLTIWNALRITEEKTKLQIDNADKVLWEWYFYGKPQTKENLFFEEYKQTDGKIEFKTNVNWFKKDSPDLTIKKPAVALA